MAKNIKYQMQRAIEQQLELGTSKRADEREHNGRAEHIHSAQTARTYFQQVRQFGDWLKERGLGHITMEQAKEHAHEYIRAQESEWSKHTARSALNRVFDTRGDELCKLDKRDPREISRGREQSERTQAIERNHPEQCEMARSIGARNERELRQIDLRDFHHKGDELYCHIRGKGGRERDALVIGEGRELVERELRERGEGRLFNMPRGANVHGMRADYAARCYEYAKEHGHSTGEMYRPRYAPEIELDKGCIAFVNENLGHGSEREYTAYYSYLAYGDKDK